MIVFLRKGDIEPIQVVARRRLNAKPLTGKTDLYVRIRKDDGLWLDWSDWTFKSIGAVVTLDQLLAEVDATNAPGLYEVTNKLRTDLMTNLPDDAELSVIPIQTPGTDAALPATQVIKVGRWVNTIEENFTLSGGS
jgi:hypothetical protein